VAVAAGYRFVDLDDLPALREQLQARSEAASLKGSVLLAREGLNFNVAGEPGALQRWLDELQADARFAALPLQRHRAPRLPFARLRVRIRPEIIRMNQPAVRPAQGRAPAVDAATLARWLAQGRCDAGRELLLLDTRNAWEVAEGSFAGARHWALARFSEFPAALAGHRTELEGRTVVSFCTGGIRCEKAALWMQAEGVAHVHQLEGGILRYLETQAGAPGWQGRCVVFDERAALDERLQPAAAEVGA
jgi:UPF0176 protein